MIEIPEKLKIEPELVEKILCEFLREEIYRIGIKRLVLGLSGGIDSAVSCFLAEKAIGKENVVPIIMPSDSSSPDSLEDAMKCIETLELPHFHTISVSPQVETYFNKENVVKSEKEAVMKNRIGNKMARERMTILYDYSVVENALVLGTSNKTELLLGYGTLHGDMASAINPIGDLYKMQVYQMAEYLGVPEAIISKPPSADLWAGQTDEGQLGFSYSDVDKLLLFMVDRRYTKEELINEGFDQEFINKIRYLIVTSQYKRRPPVIAKVSHRTIDRDFNYPRDWNT